MDGPLYQGNETFSDFDDQPKSKTTSQKSNPIASKKTTKKNDYWDDLNDFTNKPQKQQVKPSSKFNQIESRNEIDDELDMFDIPSTTNKPKNTSMDLGISKLNLGFQNTNNNNAPKKTDAFDDDDLSSLLGTGKL